MSKIETRIKPNSELEPAPQPLAEPVSEPAVVPEEAPVVEPELITETQPIEQQPTEPLPLESQFQPPEEPFPIIEGESLEDQLPPTTEEAPQVYQLPPVSEKIVILEEPVAPVEVGNGRTSEIQQESIKNALKEIINEIDRVVGAEVEFGIAPSAAPAPAIVDVDNKENALGGNFDLQSAPSANEAIPNAAIDDLTFGENQLQQPAELFIGGSLEQVSQIHFLKTHVIFTYCWIP